MEFTTFKSFICKVVKEGNQLQKKTIDGKYVTKRKFTTMQILAVLLAILSVCLLPKGFSENFAGFVIGFLGIFIGLFASIIISSFDKRKVTFALEEKINEVDKARLKKVRNHLVQFTGLTTYAILLAKTIIMLLSLVLLHEKFSMNISNYEMIKDFSQVKMENFMNVGGIFILVLHRFFVIYFLVNFFTVSIYSLTSYFTYLQSEYKRIKIK